MSSFLPFQCSIQSLRRQAWNRGAGTPFEWVWPDHRKGPSRRRAPIAQHPEGERLFRC